MISRRLLRIKTMQLIYSYFQSHDKNINQTEKELSKSILATYDLYHYLLLLIPEIINYAGERIELGRQKLRPTPEDINPNTRFIDNKISRQIETNKQLLAYTTSRTFDWKTHEALIKKLYYATLESKTYIDYMNSQGTSYNRDKSIIIFIFREIISSSELLYQILEEYSIYWNDEVEFIISMIIKTLNSWKEQEKEHATLMRLYKNDDDKEFVKRLFRKTILNHVDYRKLIENFIKNWDFDRIALMDILLMQMAIAEIIEFPSIPTKVTLNEYIEIAKFYSTKNSGVFINGLLDKITDYMKKEKMFTKTGRGVLDK